MKHIAQINVSTLLHGIDDPRLTGFGLGAQIVNRAAASAAGHIWSEQTYDETSRFITRSVWESCESLEAFAYSGIHARYMKRSSEWFKPANESNLALWWIPKGHEPGIEEALNKLALLRRRGSDREVFDFAYLRTVSGRAHR